MSKKLCKICFVIVAGLSLVIFLIPVNVSLGNTNEIRWSSIPLPDGGESGKWMLAGSADTKCLTVSSDGTLYCYANPDSTDNTLFKSTDEGLTWSSTGQVKDVIVAIATAPNDPATIYYATASTVYRSSDAGTTFITLPPYPGGAGSNNIQITALAVVRTGSSNLVAVGTSDTDFGNYGGVYFLDESYVSGVWQNTGIGASDVYHLAFSTDYSSDGLLVAVTSNGTDTIVRHKVGDAGWGQILGDACLPAITPVSAMICFLHGYSASAGFFLALDTGTNSGDVFRVTPQYTPVKSALTALGVGANDGLSGIDISSLTCVRDSVSMTLVAGCAHQARTYISFDEGFNWMRSQKSPVGQSDTRVVAAPGFNQQKVYAVTCGTGSAFSVSLDCGMTWRQTSLIDSRITTLVDFTVMPAGSESVLFLITHDGVSLQYHLWSSQDNGSHWDNLFSSDSLGNEFHLVEANGNSSLFLAGQKNGSPAVWISKDLGQTFISYPVPCSIDVWTSMDTGTFFIGGYDGSHGVVYRTDNEGVYYSSSGQAGTRTLTAMALSPDYAQDMILAVGNAGGQVFISRDGGISFQQLGQQLPVTAGTGKISLAFDNDFSSNNILYAAVDTKTTGTDCERIFSFHIGDSVNWHSLYGSLPENAVISSITVSGDGGFYAINGQGVVTADNKGGLIRALTPASQSAIEFTSNGLDENTMLGGLWPHGSRLYSFDKKYTRLMTLTDNLTAPVILESPQDGLSGIDTGTQLKWQVINGATEYEWQINDEESFSSLPAGFCGTISNTSVKLDILKTATSYYWRVRAVKPFHSPWSLVQSFTTLLGGENAIPEPGFPVTGSIVGISPVFMWNTVADADRYELVVDKDPSFTAPVICCDGEKALLTNAWQCDIELEYDTNYFWKVRACTATNYGEWSAVNIFTTEKTPTTAVQGTGSANNEQSTDQSKLVRTESSQPQTLATNTATQWRVPDWVLYVGIGLLAIIILLLAILIVVLIASQRLRRE